MDFKLLALIATFVACAFAHGHGHGYRNREFGQFRFPKIPDQAIKDTLTKIVMQESPTDLIQFLRAMNSTEGRTVLSRFNVPPVAIEGTLKQLSGTPSDVAAAKAALQPMLLGIKYVRSSDLHDIFNVYQLYIFRETATQVVKQATFAELSAVLQVLATPATKKQNQFAYGINFIDLNTILKAKGQAGITEVVEKIVTWIYIATPQQLQKAGDVYRSVIVKFPAPDTTTAPPTTQAPIPTTTLPRVPAQP